MKSLHTKILMVLFCLVTTRADCSSSLTHELSIEFSARAGMVKKVVDYSPGAEFIFNFLGEDNGILCEKSLSASTLLDGFNLDKLEGPGAFCLVTLPLSMTIPPESRALSVYLKLPSLGPVEKGEGKLFGHPCTPSTTGPLASLVSLIKVKAEFTEDGTIFPGIPVPLFLVEIVKRSIELG